MEIKSGFTVKATIVSNEFIDRFMADANGEYVKVYLYVLRHQDGNVEISRIADALNHTESDVRRALAYWEKMGVLRVGQNKKESEAKAKTEKPSYGPAQLERLAEDDEFSQLLYIVQKYMNKIFSQREMEVFAYLYDGLRMSAELLEYLVEYCVQSGHISLRYIETVAISWHEKGFRSVEEARAYAESFKKNTFSVMKAFGLTDRKPAEQEKEMIDRWFTTYGFTRELVLEACNRTINATHSPSFQYAERILSGWKRAGVRTMRDVKELDLNRQAKARTAVRTQNPPTNQFHNFDQRETNYNDTALDDMKAWLGSSTGGK